MAPASDCQSRAEGRNHLATREVEKDLVVELAFDSAHESPRHKSGIALRFPRVSRIRWDKPASEADTIETVRKLIG